ncbi:MAG TPA: bifunctional UDP-N-acetylglucosamine diphosphorylase/glucosamine-1-phosphate N-acetyltransferase GlmU [Terriglobales bacterium]|jgi:bifunctional UDP-N-acetylglucosamine pyrophosphorylase/glucosamine-1-phosphate N-acetyltransferase|nr:bifunctional UDP-N-acetylglucosamine diphosphorylase/glucosamine-1-phosphate N-acetyltransferase GlmU [Terriglobales bacterium]
MAKAPQTATKSKSKLSAPTTARPRIAIAIMAAGKGTRLKSKHPKVLHEVGGRPILAHVIATAQKVVPAQDIFVIIGHEAERVREAVAGTGVNFVLQTEQRGTGHALMAAREALLNYGQVIVLSGDAPLITAETVRKLSEFHGAQKATMTLLSADLDNPFGYGRVIRKGKGSEVQAIVEEKSASARQKKIREINSGFYAFDAPSLYEHIDRLSTANPHGEYYLTDMADVFQRARKKVVAIKTDDAGEVLGSNTRAEMMMLDARLRLAKCRELLDAGVTVFYPHTCVIDNDVEVGADTVIEAFVQLLGQTKIGADCRIRSYSIIENSIIGDRVTVRPGTLMEESRVDAGAVIGPYTHMRPGSEVGEGAHVGNFVETKKVKLGKGSKANHLTYLGDAEIGEGVNIGAGTITCNYDGVNKHQTLIEDGVFIGSDSTLVAPVKIGRGAYVAAASCITEDVPADALALGRARQSVKEGWARAKREARDNRKAIDEKEFGQPKRKIRL